MSLNALLPNATPPSSTMAAVLPVYSVTPFTMLDFPGHTACIVWFSGCNMRCPYCHNPELVKNKGKGRIEQVLNFLQKRSGLLDGVVISGGEASVYSGLDDFITEVKKMGYAVKLDTNGLRPEVIEYLLNEDMVDYIALDYKAPPYKFKKVTGTDKFTAFSRTLDILCTQKNIPFEVRTTVHTVLLDEADIQTIIHDLEKRGYEGNYYIQNFRADNDRMTLKPLPHQNRTLDVIALTQPNNFSIYFRNFE